jgi:hypothetical protein
VTRAAQTIDLPERSSGAFSVHPTPFAAVSQCSTAELRVDVEVVDIFATAYVV